MSEDYGTYYNPIITLQEEVHAMHQFVLVQSLSIFSFRGDGHKCEMLRIITDSRYKMMAIAHMILWVGWASNKLFDLKARGEGDLILMWHSVMC